MQKYEFIIKREQEATQVECDVCHISYKYEDDRLETQEFIRIKFTGGYSSVFGDGRTVSCDICQHCFKKLLGKYVIRSD